MIKRTQIITRSDDYLII